MKRLFEKDRPRLMEYLLKEPYFNTYIIGDVENFGLDGETVKIFCEENDEIQCVVMMYRGDFVVYSYDVKFDAKKVSDFIAAHAIWESCCISGKGDVIDLLHKELPERKIRTTYFSYLPRSEAKNYRLYDYVTRITEEDGCVLRRLYLKIEEFAEKYKQYTNEDMKTAFEGGRTFGVFRDGSLIAAASSTAESSYCTMITNVCTDPEYRNQGLASIVMQKLICSLIEDDIHNICLYYDNPAAGAVYRKIGFQEVGVYKTLR